MQQNNRQSYLDWLRMLAIIGVLFFHSAQPFASENDWHIMNNKTSDLFAEFTFWLSRFRMPLLFFISGAVTYFILKKKTATQFVGLRFQRLIIPLIFGMLVIVPPQIYLERLNQDFKGNFFDFYPSIFSGEAYPKGNTSWHHLWFIVYLFVYDLVAVPLFSWLTTAKAAGFIKNLEWLAKGKRIYLLTLPSIIVFSSLILSYPQTNDLVHDLTYLPYFFMFFVPGFICICNPKLMDSIERLRRTSLLIALLSIILMNYRRWNDIDMQNVISNWGTNPLTYLYLSIYPIIAWAWVLALVGYGKKYLNKTHKALSYINQVVYPFYILHQTVIVILAYYVVKTTDTIESKYFFIVTVTFIICIAVFHLLIRPYKILRFLFGMKEQKEVAAKKIITPVNSTSKKESLIESTV
ncbi:MAG: acyltransferase 3 [Segetibacter sp.]|nr:acyltransferase 3 [Segetibacter sp.]